MLDESNRAYVPRQCFTGRIGHHLRCLGWKWTLRVARSPLFYNELLIWVGSGKREISFPTIRKALLSKG